MRRSSIPLAAAATGSVLLCAVATAAEPIEEHDRLLDALGDGQISLEVRLRAEFVDQDGVPEDAEALHADVKLGYRTAPWRGFEAGVEFEYVAPIGDEDFRSPTNPDPDFPVVADPEGAELNQLWLGWHGGDAYPVSARAGRQRIVLDNQRHVGAVAWRLNEQTFDGVLVETDAVPQLDLLAAGLWNINTVLGSNRAFDHALILHGASAFDEDAGIPADLTGYLLLYDFQDDVVNDQYTAGARGTGTVELNQRITLLWEAEAAWQGAYADRDDFGAPYTHLVAGLAHELGSIRVGYELLGSDDGAAAVQTPLGTNHAFSGWADRFLTTPATGLQDVYLKVVPKLAQLPRLKTVFMLHDFSAHEGGDHYGFEVDAMAAYSWEGGLTLGGKAAFYDADDFATDTSKFWFWLAYGF